MASITLTTVWLSLASDLANAIKLDTMTGLTSTPQNAGAVRRYAAGRTRSVSPVGVPNQFALITAGSPRATIEWLEDHTGETVLVRDDRGRKFYGSYFQPATAEHPYNTEGDVTVSFTEVSFDEAV